MRNKSKPLFHKNATLIAPADFRSFSYFAALLRGTYDPELHNMKENVGAMLCASFYEIPGPLERITAHVNAAAEVPHFQQRWVLELFSDMNRLSPEMMVVCPEAAEAFTRAITHLIRQTPAVGRAIFKCIDSMSDDTILQQLPTVVIQVWANFAGSARTARFKVAVNSQTFQQRPCRATLIEAMPPLESKRRSASTTQTRADRRRREAEQMRHGRTLSDDVRLVCFAVLATGLRYEQEKEFLLFFNIVMPSKSAFYEAQKGVASELVRRARHSAAYWASRLPAGTVIAFDGSWSHRRQADQHLGAFIALTPDRNHEAYGKVVDFVLLGRRHCRQPGNYEGSPQGMETAGLAEMSGRWAGSGNCGVCA
jgi:hypothetical protein